MNVIGSRPNRWWNDPDRAVHRMVEELGEFAERTGDDVTVVFDRKPTDLAPGRHGTVVVAFPSRRGRNAADDEIARMISAAEVPAGVRVVTSDARLVPTIYTPPAQEMYA